MNRRARWVGAVALGALASCGPPPGVSGGGVPPGATPMDLLSDRDPIGFLLQWRDSIGISDSSTLQLSRLNIRLFRRNGEVQLRMDTLLRGERIERRSAMRADTTLIPDSLRARLAPLRELIAMQTAAARDTARAMLTDGQRERADSLEAHLRERMRRGPGPTMDTQGRAGPATRP